MDYVHRSHDTHTLTWAPGFTALGVVRILLDGEHENWGSDRLVVMKCGCAVQTTQWLQGMCFLRWGITWYTIHEICQQEALGYGPQRMKAFGRWKPVDGNTWISSHCPFQVHT